MHPVGDINPYQAPDIPKVLPGDDDQHSQALVIRDSSQDEILQEQLDSILAISVACGLVWIFGSTSAIGVIYSVRAMRMLHQHPQLTGLNWARLAFIISLGGLLLTFWLLLRASW